MSSALAFYQNLRDDLTRAVKSVMPFRATANGDAAGKASIIRLGQSIADGESYGRLDGFDVAAGDDLVCFTIGGKPVVAKLLNSAPAIRKLSSALEVTTDHDTALRVGTASGSSRLVMDTIAGELELVNAVDLVLKTGVTSGEVARIDGATGAATFGSVNTPVIQTLAQSAADAASTTSTSTYATAATLNVALPAGTWTIYAVGGASFQNSAGGNVRWAIEINGAEGVARLLSMTSSEWQPGIDDAEASGLSGTVAVKVQYRSSTANTSSARNPWLIVIAKRTA